MSANQLVREINSDGLDAFLYANENFDNMSAAQMQQVARAGSMKIVEKCHELGEAQNLLHALQEVAENVEGDWYNTLSFGLFGESTRDKQVNVLVLKSRLQDYINENMMFMQQATIALIGLNAEFSRVMMSELRSAMTQKFRDTDGQLAQLGEQGKRFANAMVLHIQQKAPKQEQAQNEGGVLKRLWKRIW